ncbi:flippase [Parafilimonas sp.]|uniref:flippase n=1 Tax=Parafilimonas sp. TaxID=1969739 RepID=UPI0039E22A28
MRSAFYTILQRFSLTFFGLINFMVLARVLSHTEMGIWALFLTVTTVFEASKSGLLKNAHVRYVSSSNIDSEKIEVASSSFIINLVISIIFIAFIWVGSEWLSTELNAGLALSSMLLWFIPGIVCMIFFSHLEAVQQSYLDFKGVSAGYLVRQVIFFILIAANLFFKANFSLNMLALYQSVSILAGTITLYAFTKKYLVHRYTPKAAWIKKILGYGGYIFGSGIMGNIYSNIDKVMAAKFISSSSVSFYNTASRINGMVDIPSYAAAEILFPKTAQASAYEGKERVKYLYEKMVSILLSFTIPFAIFVILFPKLVITIIAGPSYLDAALILQLYMLSSLFRPMQNQAANLLNSINKPALCFWINTLGLAEGLLINYACLYYFGFYGAAIGTLIASVTGTVFWYFVMRRHIGFEVSAIVKYTAGFYKTAYTGLLKILNKKSEV